MDTWNARSLPRPRLAFAVLVVLAVGACAPPPGQTDYRQAFPVTVEPTTVAVQVRFSEEGTLSRAEEERFQGAARDYLRRGRSGLVIATPPDTGDKGAERLANAAGALLVKEGVRGEDIVLKPGLAAVGGKGAVVLSFRAYGITVGECGDWSGEAGFNPTNLAHTNYGCSYQRNLGLMVSDPGDLVKPADLGSAGAQRSGEIIKNYVSGKPTGADAPKGEKGTVSTVGGK